MFGTAIDLEPVRIRRRKFFPLQPQRTVMAPRGHVHFHPRSSEYCDDIAEASIGVRALFIHEMTHVWQAQQRGDLWLVFMRHPFCRYDYTLKPGWRLERYGIEQQAEIVKHAFLLRSGQPVRGVADRSAYDHLVKFPGASR